jgi:hypothetical protein
MLLIKGQNVNEKGTNGDGRADRCQVLRIAPSTAKRREGTPSVKLPPMIR